MTFFKEQINENNSGGRKYAVYMLNNGAYYICDMIDGDSPGDVATNELGLTLRARLARSKGRYAMLDGTIFNPERLLDAACEINDFKKKEVSGGEKKKGYTLLTITADGCVNSYMIFDQYLLNTLTGKLNSRLVKRVTEQY